MASPTVPTKHWDIGKDRFMRDETFFVYKRQLPNTQIPKSEVADNQFEKCWPKICTLYAVQQGLYQFGTTLYLHGPHYQVEAGVLEERLDSHWLYNLSNELLKDISTWSRSGIKLANTQSVSLFCGLFNNTGKIVLISVNQTDVYEDDFLYVENTTCDKSFAWDLIGMALAWFPNDNKKPKKAGNHWQHTFVDIGICSNLCQALDSLGVWGPNLFVNTDSTIAHLLFDTVNQLWDLRLPKFLNPILQLTLNDPIMSNNCSDLNPLGDVDVSRNSTIPLWNPHQWSQRQQGWISKCFSVFLTGSWRWMVPSRNGCIHKIFHQILSSNQLMLTLNT